MSLHALVPLLATAVTLCLMPSVGSAQRGVHIIRGRIAADSGAAIPAADVILTIAPTAEVLTTKSDSTGAFRIAVPNPTGEYLLYVSALGHRPHRQRVTIAASDSVATITVKLPRAVAVVAALRVQATHPRPRPTLGVEARAGTDGTDKTFDGVAGQLAPDVQGDLDAMAATIPGLSVASGGVSAFGLGSDANATVLNGLAFGGSDMPRELRSATRFRTSPWDPTIGGFSGVQASVSLLPGTNVTNRRGRVSVDAPALQLVDPAVARAGQRYTSVAFDEGGSGALRLDKLFYNFGLRVTRQTTPMQSLLRADPGAIARAGVAPDSAARVLAVATALGVPIDGGGNPGTRTTSSVSFVERFDRAQTPGTATTPPSPMLALTVFGKYSRSDAVTLSPTTVPAAAGQRNNTLAGLQWLYARHLGKGGDYLNETTSGLTLSSSRGTPYVDAPGSTILIASNDGIANVSLGGNGVLANANRALSWELINQTSFLAGGRESLPIKLYVQSRLDTYDQAAAANRTGRFAYASLADFAANRPSTFARTLNAANLSGGEWIGAGAVAANWLHNTLTVNGGLRLDANAFTVRPRYNGDVDALLGVRTDRAPNTLSLSPRLGFVWRYTATTGYTGFSGNGATVNRGQAQLRGGIGKFRSVLAPGTLSDAIRLTGLPGAPEQLLCVGSAVPEADWQRFNSVGMSAVPSSCAGDRAEQSDDARPVSAFAGGFRPSESWRGTLGWTKSSLLGAYVALDAVYSLTTNRSSNVDRNLTAVPQFALADDGRPVYVPAANIATSTGSLSPAGARRTTAYGSVSERLSDLRADARQLTATVMPNLPILSGTVILSYAYTDARTQSRGFDLTTGGDPRGVEWSPSSLASRHAFTGQFAKYFARLHSVVSTAFRAYSGWRFTPTIGGDVNGDGLANDRAFVYDPSSTGDDALASDMRSLLANGPRAARDCLAKQLRHIAAQNSCVGPWGTTMNANVSFVDIPHLGSRTRVNLFFSNITSGLDQALHGSSGLRGWGSLPIPQSTLLQPRGFDPVGRRFVYYVNPRFGSSSPATTIVRNPFRVTIDVEFGLGSTGEEQRVQQNIRVRPSLTDTRASADTIKARYLRTAGTDIYAFLLRLTDSLALSRSQVEALQARQPVLRQRADSIYTELANHLVQLPAQFNSREAAKRVFDARESLWVAIRAERPFILSTLNAGQVRLLPPTGFATMLANPADRTMFFAGGW